MIVWKTSIDRDQFVNRFCLQVVISFSFTVDSSCVLFFPGRKIHAMITFTEEGTLKQRIQETYLQQGFHSSKFKGCKLLPSSQDVVQPDKGCQIKT